MVAQFAFEPGRLPHDGVAYNGYIVYDGFNRTFLGHVTKSEPNRRQWLCWDAVGVKLGSAPSRVEAARELARQSQEVLAMKLAGFQASPHHLVDPTILQEKDF